MLDNKYPICYNTDMNKTGYIVYCTDESGNPQGTKFSNMTVALSFTQALRGIGMTYVTMACENADQVGKLGVDSVENGKTPDGVEYSWVKRRDGGQ